MCAFYGWRLTDVQKMDAEEFDLADRAIKQLDAQSRVIDANVAVYPHMARPDAEKFMKSLHALAYPHEQAVRTLTIQELKERGLG